MQEQMDEVRRTPTDQKEILEIEASSHNEISHNDWGLTREKFCGLKSLRRCYTLQEKSLTCPLPAAVHCQQLSNGREFMPTSSVPAGIGSG